MSTNLRVAELDFDQIKLNLKEFLRTKPEFTDYDFEGSALSVLVDLLAYNTHYNAVIGNMMIQELYLDTAVKKQSLALISKRLGYLPQGYRAPRAIVNLEVFPSPSTPSSLMLGKNARFTARLASGDLATFVTRDAITIYPNAGRYIFENVELYEGDNATFRYVVTDPAIQKYEIPSKLVDTNLIRVYVQESINSTNTEEWRQYKDIAGIGSDSPAYYVKLNETLKYEVYFGDGILSKNVQPGNVVVIDYVTTNGPVANGISSFVFADTVSGFSNTLTTTVSSAFGGAFPETLDQIRTNAQNAVLTQNRAVTESDYAAIISSIVPVETIAVYGGETLTPAQYGKVFISLKQTGITSPLTQLQKDAIVLELKKRSVMSLVHEFIDPDVVYLGVTTDVKYDPTKTTANADTMKTIIFNGIKDYATANLNKFESTFEFSNLVGYIDDIDKAIMSNDTQITMRKEVLILSGVDNQYIVDFNTEITASNSRTFNINSTPVSIDGYETIDVYLQDYDGILQFYQLVNSQRVVVSENIGSVDYLTGRMVFNANIASSVLDTINITVIPNDRNLIPSRNNILTLADSDITITTRAA